MPASFPVEWPPTYDKAAALRLLERFSERSGPVEEANLAALLASIGGNSPYLSDLAVREHRTLHAIVQRGPDDVLNSVLTDLRAGEPRAARNEIAAHLRQAKRRAALTIAIADIAGIWNLHKVTAALSDLADACLSLALKHILTTAHDRKIINLSRAHDPEVGCGFVVLSMGKLGARELNYSSDIDLIFLYDSESPVLCGGSGREALGALMARWARDLVTLMEARDADGYVFRTDLRLRPDPSATPPAVSILAALTYYESMGQNWERVAMIKARPAAGDLDVGEQFLASIRPFVWRSHLDFAAIADIHALKKKIDILKNPARGKAVSASEQIRGYNVKLGAGGIREIEFLTQTLQVVWGGKDITLRARSTVESLRRLADAGHLSRRTSLQLSDAYGILRLVEHRVQMIHDRQTHSLPDDAGEVARVAHLCGHSDVDEFAEMVLRHTRTVHANYHDFFGAGDFSSGNIHVGNFQGEDSDIDGSSEQLKQLGFEDGQRVVAAVQRWLSGRVKALRSDRAQGLLRLLLPTILAAVGKQAYPDAAFSRFDRFLHALPAGIQIMSLFQYNPTLIERVVNILGGAPVLSEYLASFPNALEALLPTADAESYNVGRSLRDDRPEELEQAIAKIRLCVKERDFRASALSLEGRMLVDVAARNRSLLAHTALTVLLRAATASFSARHGRVHDSGIAVLALGKFGSRAMMAGSDLDLIFIYQHPQDVAASDGPKPQAPSQWFMRLVQSFVASVSAPGREGPMYLLDMRLRPSGNKGPLAVSLRGFELYHQEHAWTWERMALTRGRVVAGDIGIRQQIRTVVRQALARQRDTEAIRSDAAAMRGRMTRDSPPSGAWDVKGRAGGLIDVEFIIQVLQLVHAGAPGFELNQTTGIAAARLGKAGVLPLREADLLIEADRLWRTVQGILRLIVYEPKGDALEAAVLKSVLIAVRSEGFPVTDQLSLLSVLDATAAKVRHLFSVHVG